MLSPIDHVFTSQGFPGIDFIFEFEDRLELTSLQAALNQAAELYWPVQCVAESVDGAFSLTRKQVPQIRLNTIQDSIDLDDLPADGSGLIDRLRFSEGTPLASFTLTQTPYESYLGISLSHALCDGMGFLQFLLCWSEMAQGKSHSVAPVIDTELMQKQCSTPDSTPITPQSFSDRAGYTWSTTHNIEKIVSRKMDRVVLEFTSSELDGLKSLHECQDIGKNDFLAALLWKTLGPAWYPKAKELSFSQALDLRRRLKDIPANFFGNCVSSAFTRLTPSQINEMTVRQLADRLKADLSDWEKEKNLKDFLGTLDQLRVQEGHRVFDRVDPSPGRQGLFISNLGEFPLDQIGFGHEPPVNFRVLHELESVGIFVIDDHVRLDAQGPPGTRQATLSSIQALISHS